MKILFITSGPDCPDNLEDGLLHGLRTLHGADCVDYPCKEVMYKGWNARPSATMYGRLFTIWRTLDDLPVDRTDIDAKVRHGFFDLIVFGSITRSRALFARFEPWLRRTATILVDGEDVVGFDPRLAHRFFYFKRELSAAATHYYTHGIVPRFLVSGRLITWHPNVVPISFAIPAEKITAGVRSRDKSRLLPSHIVDDELRTHPRTEGLAANRDVLTHVFDEEGDYYRDLRESRFGITIRRGGWDCLRHYEIPANGAVLCFRDLKAKYRLNAPHGLNADNCIVYSSADELLRVIDRLSASEYERLQEGGYRWVAGQTTVVRAEEVLGRARAAFA